MHLYIVFFLSLFWFCSCEPKENNKLKEYDIIKGISAFNPNVARFVDSFLKTEPQKELGIFSIHYSRRLEGVHVTLASINYENSLEYLGLPYYYEERNKKLILYYNGVEVIENKKYNEKDFKKKYQEYCGKYNIKANDTRIIEPPNLEFDISINGTINREFNRNFNLWFNNLYEEEFQPPIVK